MGEKRYKRFYVSESENQLSIYDNEGLDDYYHLGNDERDVKCVCDLLNTLHQENQQLKHYKLYEDNKRLQTIIADLKEENEKLRKQVESSETTSNATSHYNAFLESKITTLKKENRELNSIKKFAERNGINIFLIDEAFRKCWKDNGKLFEENEQLKQSKDRFADTVAKQVSLLIELRKENEQLRQMIKENVFQRYREGSLADLEFKAIAYDDIINVKLSDESEPKVIVYCNQGKKENIMSYCQMFIPFGIAYEIKEVMNDVLK